ncbi:MAG: radical SAM protein, partial [Candidatus Omnitrophica bacterium]|nr:radical SAM protein [Candidatus Omnitrophota bacterium]
QSVELLSKYERKDIDFVIYGDGEQILHGLLLVLKNSVPKDVFMDYQVMQNGNLVANEIYPSLKPDFTGLPLHKYRFRGRQQDNNPGLTAILSEFNNSEILLLPFKFIKGCPNECIFCPESTNKIIYALEPLAVANYLKELQQYYSPTGYFFLSDTINISKKYINELCEEIIKSRLKILWTDSARADNLDRDTVFNMRSAGCIRLVFGMETGSPALLKRIDKRLGLRGLENVLHWSDEAGIWAGLEVICGLPFENEAYIQETLDFLSKNKKYINTIYFNQFGLRDGSILMKEAQSFGLNNVVVINKYSDEEFNYFHKYGYDEENGLCWKDKKSQILYSHKKFTTTIDWNTEFPIYEFEHFLFFLYSKLGNKAKVYDVFAKVQKEKMYLLSLKKNRKTAQAKIYQ